MIKTLKYIPVTKESCPFSSAMERCDLEAHGYTEREYLFSGTANVYGTGTDGEIRTEYEAVPYTNRMVLRCPANPEKFSGHVVVEIINATAHWDIERMWIISHRYFMKHGAAYVGLTSKPDVFDALKRYAPERYGEISWPNPRPEAERAMPDLKAAFPEFILADQECGLFWDMLTDMADLLRADSELNPLKAWKPKYITLTGWSQSSCYLSRYVNSFAYRGRTPENPVYDGYLAAGGVYVREIPLNQNEYNRPVNLADTFIHHMEQPLMLVQTESENGVYGSNRVPRFNSDEPGNLCRLVEIAGATHDTRQSMVDYYDGEEKMAENCIIAKYQGEHPYPCDYPYDYPMNAAYHHLFCWIESGEAPRIMPRITWNEKGTAVRDALGNCAGGVRTAFVDLPTCRYIPWSIQEANGEKYKNGLFGHIEKFSAEFLRELYGSLSEYEERVREATASHVAKGYVLQEEAELLVKEAVQTARARGLY